MYNILISGANGKMGKKVLEALSSDDQLFPACGVDLNYKEYGDFIVYDSFSKVNTKIDAIIDFSSPKNLDNILDFINKTKCKAVLCATGYSQEQISQINSASKESAIFRSSNMSLGVNILIELVKQATKALNGYDIEIIEKHHNQKVDAPSGTAVMFADAIKSVDQNKFEVYGRNGICGKRNPNEIGIHAIRGGNIVGEHQIIFAGENEVITLTHSAQDRAMFAQGAVKACKYILTKETGLYDMSNVIKENA